MIYMIHVYILFLPPLFFGTPLFLSLSLSYPLSPRYGNSVNFILINGDDPKNFPIISRFHADAIPHLALLSPETKTSTPSVITSLVGSVPEGIVAKDIRSLSRGETVEVKMEELFEAGEEVIDDFR